MQLIGLKTLLKGSQSLTEMWGFFYASNPMAPARSAGHGYERGVAAGISKRVMAMGQTR
jgi:hypothetical protein